MLSGETPADGCLLHLPLTAAELELHRPSLPASALLPRAAVGAATGLPEGAQGSESAPQCPTPP